MNTSPPLPQKGVEMSISRNEFTLIVGKYGLSDTQIDELEVEVRQLLNDFIKGKREEIDGILNNVVPGWRFESDWIKGLCLNQIISLLTEEADGKAI